MEGSSCVRIGARRVDSDRSESSACFRTVWRRVRSPGELDSPWIWATKASRGSMQRGEWWLAFRLGHSLIPTQWEHGTVTRSSSFLFPFLGVYVTVDCTCISTFYDGVDPAMLVKHWLLQPLDLEGMNRW